MNLRGRKCWYHIGLTYPRIMWLRWYISGVQKMLSGCSKCQGTRPQRNGLVSRVPEENVSGTVIIGSFPGIFAGKSHT